MRETNLQTLIRSMHPRLMPGTFVFVTLPPDIDVSAGITSLMTFREAEGLTLIVSREEAQAADLAHTFPSRMITLEVQSSLEAVGFLATVTAQLATVGIAVNPVSGFHHDHLFVPEDRADAAITALAELSRSG